MYRKPLLAVEDAEPLIGQLTRFEFSPHDTDGHRDWVGVVTDVAADEYDAQRCFVTFRRANGDKDEVLFMDGYNVVFATTVEDMRDVESPFTPVLWRDRHTLG